MERKSRNTKQKELLQEKCTDFKEFFTAEELLKKAKEEDESIGIATIYRFLKDKKKQNKIFSYVCDRKTIYSNQEKSHCHYICEKTGKIIHFNITNLDFLKEIRSKIPGSINSFQIEIKGICRDCKINN
jgi:Fe2+ or Zn2+ uptake regulation protein